MDARLLVNHSYFHDALSGEFRPPTDSQHRRHTLARLLIATFEKGSVTGANTHNEEHLYVPSWAPISSVVRVSHWDIRSLTLTGQNRELKLTHTLNDREHRSLRVEDTDCSDVPLLEASLSHEQGYEAVRKLVTLIAQDFFTSLMPPVEAV